MDRKKTKMNTSNSSQTPMEVRKRLEKLEKEKEELEERMKQLKADRDEERAKTNLYTEIQRVRSTVNAMQQLMFATAKKATDELQNNLGASVEKISCDVDKVSGSVDMIKYEVEAIIIEREKEWKKERDELLEEVRRLQQEAGEHERLAAERHQTVQTVSTAIEERVADISSKIDRTEERQTANHNEIIQRLTPVEEQVRIISRQVDKTSEQEKTILILGGYEERDTANMFILRKDRWIRLSLKLPKKNYDGGAVFLKGELYIFGGFGMEKETYKLDKQLEWKRLADMNEERAGISNSCLEWKGEIWVFGGGERDGSVERYDPKEDKWTRMPDMKYTRFRAAAAVWNDKFIVCGGCSFFGLESVECFDPESGIWSELNDMPSPYRGHSLVPYGNKLILTKDKSVLELSDAKGGGKWRELPPMEYAHSFHSATILNHEMFVIGGQNRTEVEIFDGQKWRDGPPLPFKLEQMSAVVIPSHLLIECESN